MDFIYKSEGINYEIEWDLLVEALDGIRKSGVKDAAGVSVLVLRAFVFGCPSAAIKLFSTILKSTAFLQSFHVEGTIYGKESKFPSPEKTRAILPLPALLVVLDAAIAVKMCKMYSTHCIGTYSKAC